MSYDVTDFQQQVLEKSRSMPVVVDFWAVWCGPCRVLGPILERLETASGGRWTLARVDTDVHQEVAREFGIRGIPNVRMFIDGASVAEFTGALPEAAVVQWLRKNLPDAAEKEVERARALIAEGKNDEGVLLLRGVVEKDANNIAARVALASALFSNNHAEAGLLVKDIEADSEHFGMADAIHTVADLELRAGNPAGLPAGPAKEPYLSAIAAMSRNEMEKAIDGFIQVIRQDKAYDEEGARRACIALFRILGDESAVTRIKRREFSSALFV